MERIRETIRCLLDGFRRKKEKKKENRRMDARMKGQIRIISCVLLVLPGFLFFPEEE